MIFRTITIHQCEGKGHERKCTVSTHAFGHFYLHKPDVIVTQVGVNSIILDQLLQVTFTSYGTKAFI